MTLCQNCDVVKNEYTGNGSQTDYTFTFEYNQQSDVAVALWDPVDEVWVPTSEWTFLNDTFIRFFDAPENGQQIMIYRCTGLEPLPAEFYPGTAIKAQDLNDNFFVLKSAIEESRCFGGGGSGGGGTSVNKLKEADNQSGRWVDGDLNNDEFVPTAAAVSDRLDPFFQEEVPPAPNTWRLPGKLWYDSDDITTKIWDQVNGTWVVAGTEGPPGPPSFPDAPADGLTYARRDNAWVEVSGSSSLTFAAPLVQEGSLVKIDLQTLASA